LKQDGCPEGGGEAPKNPCLIVELENCVDAPAKLITEIEKLRAKDEQSAEEDEQENKGAGNE
jgi:hypothetical protein